MGRRVIFTEKKIASRIREGYGQGSGSGYKSWLKVGDFPSLGRCHRIRGTKINRIYHFFSDLEQYYFYLLEWQDNIEDIREQFPLFPVSETERIASSMKYKHPQNVGGHNSCVMTTDFLITTKIGKETQLFARSVKYAKEIEKKRVLQKLSIEKAYWDRHGITWQLVTEDSISITRCKNIRDFLAYYEYPLSGILNEENASEPIRRLIQEILIAQGTLSSITAALDSHFKLTSGSMLSLFRHLAAHKIIPVYIDNPFVPTNQIESLVDIPLLKEKHLLEERGYAYTS
jgi:hypothetical protein